MIIRLFIAEIGDRFSEMHVFKNIELETNAGLPHTAGLDCYCKPSIEHLNEGSGWVVIHN